MEPSQEQVRSLRSKEVRGQAKQGEEKQFGVWIYVGCGTFVGVVEIGNTRGSFKNAYR